jgi:hypothetical protein
MVDNSSGTMIIDTEHLRSVTNRNIYLVRQGNDGDDLESVVREAAAALSYHVARLDGRELSTEEDILCALGDALHFPSERRGASLSSWPLPQIWPEMRNGSSRRRSRRRASSSSSVTRSP